MSSVSYPLSRGGFAIVDEADVPLLHGRNWIRVRCGKKEYACCDQVGKPKRLYMHRFLLGVAASSRPWVDHKNGDGLNNTRANLRLVTPAINSYNRKTGGTYRGIAPQSGGFVARVGGVYGGLYGSQTEAAIAADRIAIELYGEDARLNFPPEFGTATLTRRFMESQ